MMDLGGDLHIIKKDQAGLTLIDMAVVLAVAGLLAIPILQGYQGWKTAQNLTITNNNIALVNTAISEFYFENGRYPCPAVGSLGTSDPDYGQEACNHASVDLSPGVNDVLFGTVPFATLKISNKNAADAWLHKLKYAVTEAQARNTLLPMSAPGVLTIAGYRQTTNPNGEVVCDATWTQRSTTAHYVVTSAGENAVGAQTLEGVQVQACGVSQDIENENCNNDRVFVWDTCAHSSGSGAATRYDDFFYFQENVPARMWTYDVSSNQNIISDTSNGNIGINNKNPQTQVDVIGNIKTTQNSGDFMNKPGNTNSAQLCNGSGSNCFSASVVGGSSAIMNCEESSSDRGMTGIAQARVSCGPSLSESAIGSCLSDEYVVGIDSQGRLICGVVQ